MRKARKWNITIIFFWCACDQYSKETIIFFWQTTFSVSETDIIMMIWDICFFIWSLLMTCALSWSLVSSATKPCARNGSFQASWGNPHTSLLGSSFVISFQSNVRTQAQTCRDRLSESLVFVVHCLCAVTVKRDWADRDWSAEWCSGQRNTRRAVGSVSRIGRRRSPGT